MFEGIRAYETARGTAIFRLNEHIGRLFRSARILGIRPRMIRIASAVANVSPGATRPVTLKLTKRGRKIVRNNKKRRLKDVIAIRNTPGTSIDTTPITIRLR